MDQVTLSASPRLEAGSRPARRLRRSGFVPAVVYGRDMEPLPVNVATRDLFAALRTEAGLNAVISLEVDGTAVLTVAREIQRHPVRGDITHLDFIKVSLDEEIQAEVNLDFVGTPPGVTEDGGVVEAIETSVTIRALPTQVPSSIEVDISELRLGDTIKFGDLPAIEGVEYLDEEDRPVVTVLIPRVVEEEVPEEELEEELEGEEAVEGEAAAEEGAGPEAEKEAGDEG